ncbi:MAG: LytR/AlgR family response regulator transcription factor [Bacillota bacterium]
MPGKKGKAPYIVFVTAYEEFALDAFCVNAVDYLLKPIDPGRFEMTLQKVLSLEEKQESAEPQKPAKPFSSAGTNTCGA